MQVIYPTEIGHVKICVTFSLIQIDALGFVLLVLQLKTCHFLAK